jgi:hypothetical protein
VIVAAPKLFGTVTRTKVLVALALLGESYPRELSRLLGIPLMSVQRAINDFDREGVTASRIFGVQRQVRLNPRYFALAQLRELLLQLSEALPEERHAIELLRRRPRRAGKAV